MNRWWSNRSRGQRFVLAVIGSILAVNIAATALGSAIDRGPSGTPSSPRATAVDGLAGLVELLRETDHDVTVTTGDLGVGDLDPAATVFLIDPLDLEPADVEALTAFTTAGGRLVLAGPTTIGVLTSTTGVTAVPGIAGPPDESEPADDSEPTDEITVTDRSGLAGRARVLAGDAGHRWSDTDGLEPIAGPDDRPFALTAPVGAGRVIALADTEPLRNRNLARADNAAFGVALAADRPVVMIDRTDPPDETGFAAIPTHWRWTGVALAFATVLALWSFGTRFGPPEPDERPLRPARMDHVAAVAAGIVRQRPDPATATERIRERERTALARTLGADPAVSDPVLTALAADHGIPGDLVTTILTEPANDDDALRLGRIAAERAARTRRTAHGDHDRTAPTSDPGDRT